MFTREQLRRYARHIILPGVGSEGQQRLLDASVLVIGAGGLGSPILLYLAAAGVGRIVLVDPDDVDLSNLQRQVVHDGRRLGEPKVASAADRLHDLNPDVTVERHRDLLGRDNARGLVASVDLVLDGSDNFPTRYLVNDACLLEQRMFVYGAISPFDGHVSVFGARAGVAGVPPARAAAPGPCYRCLFPTPPEPGSVPSCAEAGVLGVLPGIVGSMMAAEAIKLIVGLGDPLAGRLLVYDLLAAETRSFEIARDPACPVCGDHPSITELVDYEAFCGIPG